MTPRRAARSQDATDPYSDLGYDATLEAVAFRRLAEWDVDGTRTAFGRLVDQLTPEPDGNDGRIVALLLLDVAQRINRRIHHPTHNGTLYHATRLQLVREFAACTDAEAARRAFAKRLNQFLAAIQASRSSIHPLIQKAYAYIEEHYQSRIGLAQIAKFLHVSPSYLSRLFRKETGSTLTATIHRVRLEHARLLLATGARSISEIAFLVGYQTYRDFYRNFVKYERASPRQARRRIRAEGGSLPLPGELAR